MELFGCPAWLAETGWHCKRIYFSILPDNPESWVKQLQKYANNAA